MTHLIFDVSSGVDERRLATNIAALVNLPKVQFEQDGDIVENFDAPYFVACVLLAWFVALGISVDDLRLWIERTVRAHFQDIRNISAEAPFGDVNKNLKKIEEFFLQMKRENIPPDRATLFPLPSFIDVRYSCYLQMLTISLYINFQTSHFHWKFGIIWYII